MEREQHELYEYARKRLKQRRILYILFFILVSLFLFISTKSLILSLLQTGIYG
jgi:predicted nucleic acid-binding Zn ribbon protein